MYQSPSILEFALPHSDGNGTRLRVSYQNKKADITLFAVDSILVDKKDLEWLIDVLQDVNRLCEENVAESGNKKIE